jgi:hypothetical protein
MGAVSFAPEESCFQRSSPGASRSFAAMLTQASNENDGGNSTGGYAPPGSTVGVNPAYHQGRFGKYRTADRAGDAFGYAPLSGHKHKSR